MKAKLYLIIPIVLITNSLYGQNNDFIEGYILEYEESWDKNRKMKGDLPFPPETVAYFNRVTNAMKTYYTLYSDTKISLYKIKKKTYSDEYIENNGNKIPELEPKNYTLIYKDFQNQELFIMNGKIPKNKATKATFSEVNTWELVNEDTVIANYTCKKAIHKQEKGVEVWYTEDIPLSDGPDYYTGLPGLIVLVQDKKRELFVKLTSLKFTSFDKEVLSPEIPNKHISFEEYKNSSNVNTMLRN